PYFDGTYRDYPAFKRKFESFRMTYHRGTLTQELFQQFREMCLPEKLSIKIKSANNMENAWVRLDAWFGDKALFIKDLMQDIKDVAPIKEGDNERMIDYYVTPQAHIEEARSMGALDMLLIPANMELMVLPLTTWEKRIWREAQGRFFFCIFFWRARVCRPLLCLCRPFMNFEGCLDSNPEYCRSKLARYRLSYPSLLKQYM
ncbi:MAG: hypothetical protein ACK56F_29705, partial [bacterium]